MLKFIRNLDEGSIIKTIIAIIVTVCVLVCFLLLCKCYAWTVYGRNQEITGNQTINGMVHSTTGGFKLPDNTIIDEASDLGGGGSLWSEGDGGDIYYNSGDVGIGLATNPAARLHVVYNALIPFESERTTTAATGVAYTASIKLTSSSEMTPGYGPALRFIAKDATSGDKLHGYIATTRGATDNYGDMRFFCGLYGAEEFFTIGDDGRIGISNSDPTGKLHVILDAAEEPVMFGGVQIKQVIGCIVTAGSVRIQKTGIDTDVNKGDLVIVYSGTNCTLGQYMCTQDANSNEIEVDRTPSSAGTSNLAAYIAKDVITIGITDGTNGQRICNYSHQNKPLQIGGYSLGATSGLTSEDVNIANTLYVDGGTQQRTGILTTSPGSAFDVHGTVTFNANNDGVNEHTFGTSTGNAYTELRDSAGTINCRLNTAGPSYFLGGNLVVGTTACGTSATKTIGIATGTPTASSPADMIQIYSADQAAGNACPHFRTELGNIIKLYRQAKINDPTGGGTIDAEARAAINALIDALENLGLLSTS